MKKILSIVLVVSVFLFFSFKGENELESLVVNTKLSKVEWVGYKSTGKHNGVLRFNGGVVVFKHDSIVKGEVAVNMKTIAVLDSDSSKLLKHLKGEDFFDVEEFPNSSFKFDNVSYLKDSIILHGKMTIKDFSHAIDVPVVVYEKNNKRILESQKIIINREDYNIRYKSNSFFSNLKNNYIKDEFEMQVFVVFD